METNAVISAITTVLNWTYDVKIKVNQRDEIMEAIQNTWNSPDVSTQELVTYIINLSDALFTGVLAKRLKPAQRDKQKPQAKKIFFKEFMRGEMNNRGQIIRLIHSILEQLSPGCTGVSVAAVYASVPTSFSVRAPQIASTSQPAAQVPGSPIINWQNLAQGQGGPVVKPPLDAARILQEEEEEANRLKLASNISKIRNGVISHIINNFP